MKEIAIIGASIIGNRGAEAMLTTTIGRLKDIYPETSFNIYSIYSKQDRKLVKNKEINIYDSSPLSLICTLFPLSALLSFFKLLKLNSVERFFPESVVKLSKSDVLIDLSGVSFIDSRLIFLPYNILIIWPAILLRVPVIKFAQATGPFNNILNRISVECFLKKCKMVFARGEKTMNHLEQVNFRKSSVKLAADIAFLQKQGDSLSNENNDYLDEIIKANKLLIKEDDVLIGICPSSVVYSKSTRSNEDYIGYFYNVIKKLVCDGYKILLFPNATRESKMDKLRNNDLPVIRNIKKRFENNQEYLSNIQFIEKDLNTDSIKKIIKLVDGAVVSRFHSMIACLTLSTPVIVVGWGHKYAEVMKYFNLEEWVYDHKLLDENSLISEIHKLISSRLEIKERINDNIFEVQKMAMLQIKYLEDYLK